MSVSHQREDGDRRTWTSEESLVYRQCQWPTPLTPCQTDLSSLDTVFLPKRLAAHRRFFGIVFMDGGDNLRFDGSSARLPLNYVV
ncbi:hypothetical protein EVAR_88835_1 [Eumeta japonica]|uniref:Uncharacterized protein n=1 Tax=Eumeta variegata TaxID=151549 RepID=A0A4C1Y397_EUMVA|nr:hypothetical protein EVAR_88835_1 [Eumeta japonica]